MKFKTIVGLFLLFIVSIPFVFAEEALDMVGNALGSALDFVDNYPRVSSALIFFFIFLTFFHFGVKNAADKLGWEKGSNAVKALTVAIALSLTIGIDQVQQRTGKYLVTDILGGPAVLFALLGLIIAAVYLFKTKGEHKGKLMPLLISGGIILADFVLEWSTPGYKDSLDGFGSVIMIVLTVSWLVFIVSLIWSLWKAFSPGEGKGWFSKGDSSKDSGSSSAKTPEREARTKDEVDREEKKTRREVRRAGRCINKAQEKIQELKSILNEAQRYRESRHAYILKNEKKLTTAFNDLSSLISNKVIPYIQLIIKDVDKLRALPGLSGSDKAELKTYEDFCRKRLANLEAEFRKLGGSLSAITKTAFIGKKAVTSANINNVITELDTFSDDLNKIQENDLGVIALEEKIKNE